MNRVVITGLGAVSAFGLNKNGLRDAVVEGRCGIGELTELPNVEKYFPAIRIGAQVTGLDPAEHFDKNQLILLDRFTQFALLAAREAIAESGIDFEGERAERTTIILGTGSGGQNTLDESYYKVYGVGKRVHPFTVPRLMQNAPASHVSMENGITGPAYVVSSACSSANHAMALAFDAVRSGRMDAALTGGSEACITIGCIKAWEALRVMAEDTCRPFSKGRRGLVLGEGAGILVLESLEHAKARGAPILAEMIGSGMSSDAYDITSPSEEGGARAIGLTLQDAGLNPEDVDYINAHGTGTAANDVTETGILKRVFGDHAKNLAISSTKSMHGHALGAAGALEIAATLLGMTEGVIPATLNFTERDPACDLDYVFETPREKQIQVAVSNSFAFGGLNAIVAVKRFDG